MATLITFLISAIGHEIVMACITKKIRGYGFMAQMSQLPIVMLQRTKWVRGKHTLNNVCFWGSMILGLSVVSYMPVCRFCSDKLIVAVANACRFVPCMFSYKQPARSFSL